MAGASPTRTWGRAIPSEWSPRSPAGGNPRRRSPHRRERRLDPRDALLVMDRERARRSARHLQRPRRRVMGFTSLVQTLSLDVPARVATTSSSAHLLRECTTTRVSGSISGCERQSLPRRWERYLRQSRARSLACATRDRRGARLKVIVHDVGALARLGSGYGGLGASRTARSDYSLSSNWSRASDAVACPWPRSSAPSPRRPGLERDRWARPETPGAPWPSRSASSRPRCTGRRTCWPRGLVG